MKFCFVCGKKTEDLIDGYCQECFNKKFSLIDVPENISFSICAKCMRINMDNKWIEIEIEDFIKTKVKPLGRIKKLSIKETSNKTFEITAEGYVGNSKKIKQEKHIINADIKKVTCQSCSRKFGSYYEAVLQIRGKDIGNVVDFADTELIRLKKRNDMAFFWYKEAKGGIDIYIGNKGAAKNVADAIRKKFNAEIKRSYKLLTVRDGKEIYRDFISIRI